MFQIYSQPLFAEEEKIGTDQDWHRPRHKNQHHHNIWHNLMDPLWHDTVQKKLPKRHNKKSKVHAEWRLTQSISAKAVSEYFMVWLKIDVLALPWITRSWIADTWIFLAWELKWFQSNFGCHLVLVQISQTPGVQVCPGTAPCLFGKVSKSQKNQNWNLMPWLLPQRRKSVALPPMYI